MNFRCVLDLIVEHLVVRLLVITHKLINVLVNLNRCRKTSISVVELDIVLARLLIIRLDLDGVSLVLEYLRCLVR